MGIDCEDAWDAVRRVAGHDWAAVPTMSVRWPGNELSIKRGGLWQASVEPSADDRLLLDSLLPIAAVAGPINIAQLGQSLDGRIATVSGDSCYINGRPARAHLHRLRALVDAVVVGIGTVLADRPRLNVRLVPGRDPARVVIDPGGRMPPDLPLADGSAPLIQIVGEDVKNEAMDGVHRIVLERKADGGFAPSDILTQLHAAGFKRVLIEGGGDTVSRFVQANALDRLHLLIAPLLIGSGRAGLVLEPIERLADARRPPMRTFALDNELLVDLRLR